MTTIAIKATACAPSNLILKALIVLPEEAVISFHAEEGLLYVNDDHANAVLGYLRHADITADIVEREG